MCFFPPLTGLQLSVDGQSEGAILENVEDNKDYQLSLSALYADGAQSEAVAIRYSTCETYIQCIHYTHTHTIVCIYTNTQTHTLGYTYTEMNTPTHTGTRPTHSYRHRSSRIYTYAQPHIYKSFCKHTITFQHEQVPPELMYNNKHKPPSTTRT